MSLKLNNFINTPFPIKLKHLDNTIFFKLKGKTLTIYDSVRTYYSGGLNRGSQRLTLPFTIMGITSQVTLPLTTLILIAFKGSFIEPDLWDELAVGFVDNNPNNIHPRNLFYLPFNTKFDFNYNNVTYRRIPNFTRYGIDKYGNIFNSVDNTIDPVKVHRMYIRSDISGGYEVTPTRLLALTHLDYSYKELGKMVLLKDTTQPLSSDNIEWVVKGKGSGEGRYKPFKVMDIFTGEVTKVEDAKLYRVKHNLNEVYLAESLELYNNTPRKPHHLYVWEDETFNELPTIDTSIIGKLGDYILVNPTTNEEVFRYTTLNSLINSFGIRSKIGFYELNKGKLASHLGYNIYAKLLDEVVPIDLIPKGSTVSTSPTLLFKC